MSDVRANNPGTDNPGATGAGAIRPIRRVVVGVLAVGLVAAVLSACGLPTDERVTPYNVDDIPDQLTSQTTTTTTSTTTTTTSTTVAPQSTVPGETTTTSTSTTLAMNVEAITVYYTIGSSDDLQASELTRASNPAPQVIVDALETSTGLAQLGLRTSVRPGLIADVVTERGVATIVLDPTVLDRLPESQKQRAIAQMVLTFASYRTSDQGNIAFVTFVSDGEPYEVYVPAADNMSEPGELLAFADFASLIATSSAPTTTTTTTTTSSTSTTTTTIPEPPATTAPSVPGTDPRPPDTVP